MKKFTRLCAEFSYGKYVIHSFGVDGDKRFHDRHKMSDWFYFDLDKSHHLGKFDKVSVYHDDVRKSIYGKDVVRVDCSSIREKNRIAELFPDDVYESDVRPEFKWLMSNIDSVEWGGKEDRSIYYFDIEHYHDGSVFVGPDDPIAPITSIQGYLTSEKKYVMFTWHEQETEGLSSPVVREKGDKIIVFCKDEEEVILSFFAFLKDYDIDIIAGWWSIQFDLPYIVNRCKKLHIDYNQLSPIYDEVKKNGGNTDMLVRCYKRNIDQKWAVFICGLDNADMLVAVSEKLNYNLSNNKLATAAVEIIDNPDIEKLTEVTWKNWKDNYAGFIKYGFRDVEILKEIDDKLGIFDLYCMVQKLSNITSIDMATYESRIVECRILTECNGKYVLPTSNANASEIRETYLGGKVLDTTPGLFKDIGVVDYASLYPTSVMSFNLSPDTFICSQRGLEENGKDIEEVISLLNRKGVKFVDTGYSDELNGKRCLFYAQSYKVGVITILLKEMYEERKKIKKLMKSEKDKTKLNALDKHQYAIKIILNSVYGTFGYKYFRLYKIEIADSITFFARRALDHAIDSLNNGGYDVIYGDTDSAFFRQNGRSNEEISSWVKEFNNNIGDNFVSRYNGGQVPEYQMMGLEYEKDLEMIYFGDSKKRYYGIERGTGKKYIHGLNIIRKDTPKFMRSRLSEITECAVRGTLTVEMLKQLKDDIMKTPYDQIGVFKKFGKAFKEYIKNKPQHIKAVMYANQYLNAGITHLDIPLMFYITSKNEDDKKKKDRNNVICLLPEQLGMIDENKHIFEIDYDTFFKKQVIEQLEEFEHIEYIRGVLGEFKKGSK